MSEPPAPDTGYLLANRVPVAGARFEALAALFDGWSFQHLAAVGLAPGWRCWEVGAGGANVPRWLAGQVGPTGRVLATDIDVSWAAAAAGGPVEVRQHDVAADPPPDGPFDLVHARLVLVHVPARAQALAHMVAALKPGGWLVLEDADPAMQPLACLDADTPEAERANRLRTGFRKLMAERGADLMFGRKLPRLLAEAGLVDVRAEGFFPVTHPAAATLEAATIAHVGERMVAAGLATPAELDAHLAALAEGRVTVVLAPLITAWGRKP